MENQSVIGNNLKFCKHCGGQIPQDAVICTLCGRQVENLAGNANQPNIVINNSNQNVNANFGGIVGVPGKPINKWVSFVLCLLLGYLGAHKFYEGRIGMGILYFFTAGLFGIGWIVDIISILLKPNPYYVFPRVR